MAIASEGVSTVVVTTVLTVCLLGCGAGSESVPVPGADDVVAAPVASIDRPPTDATPTSDASAVTIESTALPPATDASPTSTTTTAPTTTAAPPASAPPPPLTEPPTTTAAPPADEPPADVFLRLGDEGPEVASMQAKLASIDYLASGSDTGVFDESTRQGLRRFQADYGLGVDGIFGPITGRALNAAVSSINVES